jgi:hypothetical protein
MSDLLHLVNSILDHPLTAGTANIFQHGLLLSLPLRPVRLHASADLFPLCDTELSPTSALRRSPPRSWRPAATCTTTFTKGSSQSSNLSVKPIPFSLELAERFPQRCTDISHEFSLYTKGLYVLQGIPSTSQDITQQTL